MSLFGGGHGHRHGHDHTHDSHGNPADLEAYVAKQEEPTRDEWQMPDEVVRALGLKPGQTVCDIGAGPGYFSLRFARAVGEGGAVLAVDVEPRILEVLRERIVSSGLRNVTPILGLPGDPLVPAASCDLIVIVNAFHHLPDGAAFLTRLQRSLKPGGRIVNIDVHKRELPIGPPPAHKLSREEFLGKAAEAGLKLHAEHGFLPHQYFLVLEPR